MGVGGTLSAIIAILADEGAVFVEFARVDIAILKHRVVVAVQRFDAAVERSPATADGVLLPEDERKIHGIRKF